jgi:hypothetical protein
LDIKCQEEGNKVIVPSQEYQKIAEEVEELEKAEDDYS